MIVNCAVLSLLLFPITPVIWTSISSQIFEISAKRPFLLGQQRNIRLKGTGLFLRIPFNFDKPLPLFVGHRPDVAAVGSVYGNTAALCDKTYDFISRYRVAAFGKTNQQIVDAFDGNPPGFAALMLCTCGLRLKILDFIFFLLVLLLFLVKPQKEVETAIIVPP